MVVDQRWQTGGQGAKIFHCQGVREGAAALLASVSARRVPLQASNLNKPIQLVLTSGSHTQSAAFFVPYHPALMEEVG